MDTLDNNWDNLVFENRRRDYGAYILRYSYPYHITVSALIVITLFISGIICHRLLKGDQIQEPVKKVLVINYSQLSTPPPIERIHVPPKTTPVVQEKIRKFVTPKVTKEEVKEEEEMPTIQEVDKNTDTSNSVIEGSGGGEVQVIAPPQDVEVVEAKPPEPEINIKQPEFPGGDKALSKWLESHLKYPPVATRMGIQGTVVVEFTVDKKGAISDVTVIKSLHRSCDNEAMRLVNSMPAWTPGESNGEKVMAKCKLQIPFVLG